MKALIANPHNLRPAINRAAWIVAALTACLGLMPGSFATAQTFTVLHDFAGFPGDGEGPQAGLVVSGNTLYGAADSGGGFGNGTVFKLNTNGTGYSPLHVFSATSGPLSTNSDGAYPDSTLVLSGSTLYGTAYNGGTAGNGTVFKVNINGTGFTTLHSFSPLAGPLSTNTDGANPESGLLIVGNTVFGTTENGGTAGKGTVFAVNSNGTGFTNLHSFTGGSDGDLPECLLISGNTLYGTSVGFNSGTGTVFKLNTNGTGFSVLHTFTVANFTPLIGGGPGPEPYYTNSDGFLPTGLTLSGSTLYGTTYWGGANGNGTVFSLNTNGTGFTKLHDFSASQTNGDGIYLNDEGTHPIQFGGLVISGGFLYGTANYGGNAGSGTVFTLNTNGTGFATLYHFPATVYDAVSDNDTNNAGANPFAGLVLAGNTLFGTANGGGSSGLGTVFSLALPVLPQLTISLAGTNVIVTWPTSMAGFTLLSTTNLAPPAVWITNTPPPVIINSQYTVTNPASVSRKFYRLIR
jgi:uncharacterized repeat protein (TIGR03803 family)